MAKKVTDEKLLEMLLIHGGVHGAAIVLGLSENAIYKRLKDDTFRQQYDQMQGVILAAATAKMAAGAERAVAALLDVLEDETASAGLRVQAANSLLSHCCRYVETSNILRRLDALEQGLQGDNE